MNDDALKKVDEIVNYIKNTEDYIKYVNARDKIKNNKEIMKMIDQIKSLQKLAVKTEHNGLSTESIDNEINDLLASLKEYPIYCEFTYVQEDLNETFQCIKTVLEEYINDKTSVK